MIGARTANGAMVMTRVSATFPRAASSEVLKNSVPARPMVTKASPAAPAAVSSMRLARPVWLAPGGAGHPVYDSGRPAGRSAPARLLEWAAEVTALAARRVAAQASSHPIATSILRLAGDYETGSRLAVSDLPALGTSMPQDEGQLLNVSPVRTRPREPDEICVQAVDLARAAAAEMAGSGQVGEHVGADAEADRVVTHLFACLDPAYRGWRWAVTLARASRAKSCHRQRGRAAAGAGLHPRPGMGSVAGAAAPRRRRGRRHPARAPPTTNGSCRWSRWLATTASLTPTTSRRS